MIVVPCAWCLEALGEGFEDFLLLGSESDAEAELLFDGDYGVLFARVLPKPAADDVLGDGVLVEEGAEATTIDSRPTGRSGPSLAIAGWRGSTGAEAGEASASSAGARLVNALSALPASLCWRSLRRRSLGFDGFSFDEAECRSEEVGE